MIKKLLSIVLSLVSLSMFFASCSGSTSGGGSGPTEWTINFDSDGGSVIASMNIADGETLTKPADPAKNGYTFDKWYLDDAEFDFSTAVSSSFTLKAKWNLVTYTITYEGLSDGDTNENPSTYNIEDTITLKPAVSEGNTFDGWYLNGEKITEIRGLFGDKTLTAAWLSKSGIVVTVSENSDITVEKTETESGITFTAPEGCRSYSWKMNNASCGSSRTLELNYEDLLPNVVYDIYLEVSDDNENYFSWNGSIKKAIN